MNDIEHQRCAEKWIEAAEKTAVDIKTSMPATTWITLSTEIAKVHAMLAGCHAG